MGLFESLSHDVTFIARCGWKPSIGRVVNLMYAEFAADSGRSVR